MTDLHVRERILPSHPLETLTTPIKEKRERFLFALLATVAFSLIANGFSYLNYYPIHDALLFTFPNSGERGWQISLGRFLIPAYQLLKGETAVPWLTGILSMLYLGISVYLISVILKQKSRLEILLTAAFLSANIATTEINAVHQYYADAFLLSLLFACLGAFFLREQIDRKSALAACCALWFSFGLYPAFITFAGCLLAFSAAVEMVESNGLHRDLCRRILIWLGLFAVSGLAYLLAGRICLRYFGLSPAASAWSIYSAGSRSLSALLKEVLNSYRRFFQLFFDGRKFTGRLSGLAVTLLVFGSLLVFLISSWRTTKKGVLLFFLVLLFLFPCGSRLVNIFTGSPSSFRTMFAQFLLLPFAVTLLCSGLRQPEAEKRRLVSAITAGAVALSLVIVWCNVCYSNRAFTVQRVQHERAVYHTGRILQELDEVYPDRDPSEMVVVTGYFKTPGASDAHIKPFRGISGMSESTGMNYEDVFYSIANSLGCRLNWNRESLSLYSEKPEVQALPCYPAPGYIREIDGAIVIKLSD